MLWCEKIEEEIRNPRLYKYSPWLYRYYKAFDVVNRFLSEIENEKTVAIWGAGRHTMILWHGISVANRKKIGYIIEKDAKRHIDQNGTGATFVYPSEVEELPIDAIIVSSYIYKEEIKKEIKAMNKHYEVLDLYNDLYDVDNVTDLFADVRTEFFHGVGYVYDFISEGLLDLKNSTTLKNTRLLLKQLIGEYLHVKDFSSAYKYIDQLCELEDDESSYYAALKRTIEDGFAKIKCKIKDKQHIVVNWIDQIVAADLPNMEFVSNLAREGVFFKNTYTQTAYTKPTMTTIFTGGLYLDDLLWKMSIGDFERSELYMQLVRQGYSFKYFGGVFTTSIFTNYNTMAYRDLTYYMNNPSMVYQWEALKEMEANDGKCFMIIHNLCETHTPCLNGMQADLEYWIEKDLMRPDEGIGDIKAKRRREQIANSEKYLDIQLQFYIDNYKDIRANVVMSDHGLYHEKTFKEYRYTGNVRTFFAVVGKGMTAKTINETLSLRKFPKIVQCILENRIQELEDCTEEYVPIQAEDAYHYRGMCRFFQNLEAARRDLIQHRGVATTKDIYVRTILGDEYYYLQGDEVNNLINEPEYQDRINELRKAAGNRYIDIYKEPKYISTRRIYELFEYEVPQGTQYID